MAYSHPVTILTHKCVVKCIMVRNNRLDKLASFFSSYTKIKYKKGEMILRCEDQPQGVYFLKKGYVKMNTILPEGKDLTLNIFKPGTYFPMMWAIAHSKNAYSFQAMDATIVYRAPRDDVITFLLANNVELYDLTRRILIALEGYLFNMEFLLTGNSLHRVTSAFCVLARRCNSEEQTLHVKISIPLTHQDI